MKSHNSEKSSYLLFSNQTWELNYGLYSSTTHYPFPKINPKHFNFDIAEVWPEMHCVLIFSQ